MGGTTEPYRRNSSMDSVHGGRGICQAVASFFNSTSVQNADTLIRLVRSRPPGIPLITVSNHMSTLDDPVMWGFKGFPSMDAKLARWVLAAEDICFKNALLSYFFQLGKCIPITRGAEIYQEHMNDALEHLSDGAWFSTENYQKCYGAYQPVNEEGVMVTTGDNGSLGSGIGRVIKNSSKPKQLYDPAHWIVKLASMLEHHWIENCHGLMKL